MGILDPGIQYANTTQSSTQTTSGAPQFIQQHQQDVLNLGRQGAVEGGVAGLTGDEQAAADLARQQTGNWVPGLSAAMQLATTAGTAGAHSGIQNYLNPYQEQVTNAAQRAGQQGLDRLQQQAIGSGIGSGGFGGSRSQRAAAQGVAQGSSDLADRIAGINAQGWNTALGASQQDLNRALQASGQLSGDAARAQALGAADVNQLSGLGKTERDINQRSLDYKLNTAKQLADLGNQAKAAYGQTTTQDTKGTSPFKSTDSKLDKLLGGGTALAQLLGGLGGGGGGNPFSALLGGAKNLFGGSGSSDSGWGEPTSGGDSSWGADEWSDSDWGGGWGGDFDWAQGGGVTPMGRLASGGMPPQPLDPEMKKSMILANPQMQMMADGGQPMEGMDMDPMQALQVLEQAGCPPELLQQCQQAMQGGGGMGGGMPPQGGGAMACGGLAHMSHGGMMHMAGGGGAYGIDPELIARLKAASSQGQFGSRDTMGMVPGARTGAASNAEDPRMRPGARGYGVNVASRPAGGLAHGGMAHMADGGGAGAYGIDPAMLQRIMAQGRGPGQERSANPFAPGHMGSGASRMSNMGGDPNNVVNERARREAMFTRQ